MSLLIGSICVPPPETRDKAVADAFGVGRVAGQSVNQRLLFPYGAEPEEGDERNGDRHRVPGAQEQSDTEEIKDRPRVHRVADESIGTRLDDLVPSSQMIVCLISRRTSSGSVCDVIAMRTSGV